MENIKIPYGISDYKRIREENYIYIDKTQYIIITNLMEIAFYHYCTIKGILQ